MQPILVVILDIRLYSDKNIVAKYGPPENRGSDFVEYSFINDKKSESGETYQIYSGMKFFLIKMERLTSI